MDVASIFGDLPTLTTERLTLRRITPDDTDAIYEYGRDPEVARYVLWDQHISRQTTVGFVRETINAYLDGNIAPWGLALRTNNVIIGTIGFVDWRFAHCCAEIGYALARQHWNQGYTSEAARAVIDFGFTQMDLNRIEARCDVHNVGSARVMEKAGMTYEGTLRQEMIVKGRVSDMKMYAILRQDWQPARSQMP